MTTTIRTDQVGYRAGFRQALASEWTKLASVRSMRWTLAAVPAAMVAIAVLVALTGSLHPDDSILAASVANAVPAQLAAGAFGALVVCGEYGSGTIRATLSACPRRRTVLAAKAVVVAGLVYGLALAGAAASYGLAAVLLAGQGRPAGAPVPALAGVALCFAAVAVIGVAAGAVLRHTAGAVAVVTGALILPALFGPLLGRWQEPVTGATPAGVLQRLATAGSQAAAETLGAGPALALVCAYSLAALAAGGWLLRHRDM